MLFLGNRFTKCKTENAEVLQILLLQVTTPTDQDILFQ